MCEPITLTTGLLIASTAVAAAGVAYSAVSSSNQAKYQSKVNNANAAMAEKASADALERGRTDAKNQARRSAALKGDQSAAMAANGLDLSFGSPLDIASDTATLGSEDALTVRENARRESLGYSINSANYSAQAAASRMQATSSLVAGGFSMGSTLLSGASQISKANTAGGSFNGALGY